MNHNQRTLKAFHHYHHHQEEEEEEQEPLIIKKLIKWIPKPIKNQFIKSNQYHNLLPDSNHHSSKYIKSSTRQSQSKSIIIIIFLIGFLIIYNLISWILDQPNHLDLDPIIDPITFQIRPTGDPLRTPTKRRTKSSVAIQQENEERQSSYNLRILHAIHRNITKASRKLKNKIVPIYDPLEEAHLDRSDALVPTSEVRNSSQFMWYKGDEGLRKNRPASRFKCDQSLGKSSTLLFIGIFTTPERVSKRNLIRTFLKADLPPLGKNHHQPLIDLVFVSGKPKNEYWNYLIQEENKVNGNDMIVLEDVENDNIDVGKTYEYFKWISQGADGRWKDDDDDGRQTEARVDHRVGRPQFVMKADDDTFLVIPNLIREFQNLSCDSNIYWGTTQGSNPLLPSYFRGLAYALSWPLVEWIGSSNMAYEAQVGIEDARVGAWLSELEPSQDPLIWIDVGWRMGDWNQLEIDEKTIGLHWLKSIEWFPMVKIRVLEAWKKAGAEFRWDWYYKLT